MREFMDEVKPALTCLILIAWLTLALVVYIIATGVSVPKLIDEYPSWFQIDCTPVMLTGLLVFDVSAILSAANRVERELNLLQNCRITLQRSCKQTLAVQMHKFMDQELNFPELCKRLDAQFAEMDLLLEQLQDKQEIFFTFMPLGRPTNGRVYKIGYLALVPLIYLWQHENQ